MQSLNFHFNVDSLESRSLPSVTPAMVYTALVHEQDVVQELHGVMDHLNDPKTAQELSFLPGHLQQLADSSKIAVGILSQYITDLQAQLAANPSTAATLEPWLGTIASADYQETINGVYAEFLAEAYGEPPPVPPPPPPSIDKGPVFSGTPLPFSLTDPAWQSIANGVRIWDVTPGSGTALASGGKFSATYTGFLTDGTIFDSSNKSGTLSTTADASHLIPGFAAGLVGMKVGGTRRIDIPASQAYGTNPPPNSGIPVNSELVFEVTLVSLS
ncbi:MAG TPA: FKBP-type peptidyl-prolyl cis-trans isomerase [Urbifossiella sp.]|nr:FKBP-type peptidyl-prolyl cis-trans isomerase [Urbifossiella sp.]